jgi:hypothetical protein
MQKLVAVKNVTDKEKHELAVKRGRRSKIKGGNYERTVAKYFKEAYGEELTRTPQSGGFAKKSEKASEFRGDVVILAEDKELLLHIECKNTKTWSLPAWLSQAEGDCPSGKIPIVVFHKHSTSKDYVCLSLNDFFSLVSKEKVVRVK